MAHTIFHHLFITIKAIIEGIALLLLWVGVFALGLMIYTRFSSPVNLALGGPLLLIGLMMGLHALYTFLVGVISIRWRRTHCPFCEPTKSVNKILSPRNGFRS